MSDLLIISHDVVGQRMAGPGIRMWELARTLAKQIPVTLIAPRPIDFPSASGITYGQYTWGEKTTLAPYLDEATTVLANSFVASVHPELLTFRGRLIVDLYDPTVFENLELFRQRPLAERKAQTQRDITLLRELLLRGDHFLCATERQRDLYIGGLLALGRLSPALVDSDPLLRDLIDVVPFGVSDDPPQASGQPALRGVLDDLNADHQIILWSSGLWDWLDPLTLVRAMPDVLTAVPQARLVFLAGRHPGYVPEMAAYRQTRNLAAELGLLGNGIHFYDEWIPYAQRADFLLEATVMVSLHRAHLETRYAAVRSRVLDHFWVGRPSIVSVGDAAAELIQEHQAGEVVPIGNSQAVAAALIHLLTDQQHWSHQSAQATALGRRLRWSQVVAPLRRMVSSPVRTTDHSTTEKRQSTMDNLQTILQERNALIRELEKYWQVAPDSPQPGSITGRVKQWLQRRVTGSLHADLCRVADQQRVFNATLINLVYRLSSAFDEQARRTEEQLHTLRYETTLHQQHVVNHLASLTQQLAEMKPLLEVVRQEQITLNTELQKARDTLPPLHQHIIDLETRILDFDEVLSQVAQRLSDLSLSLSK
ncbi:glycosyltransferase [Chloroflexus sp.]|uniref:glycosyltransferase n=1 Tax=Chloroflexus sp. TaxID=1904827 RepID=UPI002ADE560C|nr:glycosyl transferase family 1 [Chloroflexus sp.]